MRSDVLDAEAVRAAAFNNRIVDVQGLRSQAARRRMLGQLCLAPLRLRSPPSPIWLEGCFLAEFCDAFLEATGLEDGQLFSALRIMEMVGKAALEHQRPQLITTGLDQTDLQAAAAAISALHNSIPICHKIFAAQGSEDINGSLVRILKFLSRELQLLAPGCEVVVPAGWRIKTSEDEIKQFDILLVVEATHAVGLLEKKVRTLVLTSAPIKGVE